MVGAVSFARRSGEAGQERGKKVEIDERDEKAEEYRERDEADVVGLGSVGGSGDDCVQSMLLMTAEEGY